MSTAYMAKDNKISPILFLKSSGVKLFCIDMTISKGNETFIIIPLITAEPSSVIIFNFVTINPIKIITVRINIELIISV
jgi:hypothetical protein